MKRYNFSFESLQFSRTKGAKDRQKRKTRYPGVEKLPGGGLSYRGKTFSGFNKPKPSDRPGKKKMVLAKSGDKIKLVHYGAEGYKHNYSSKAKKSYLARSGGIRKKDGSLASQDKLSANFWSRKDLWPARSKPDGSSKY